VRTDVEKALKRAPHALGIAEAAFLGDGLDRQRTLFELAAGRGDLPRGARESRLAVPLCLVGCSSLPRISHKNCRGLPAGTAGKNHHHPGGGNRNFSAEIFFDQGQSESDPRIDPARRVDIPVTIEEEAGININRGIFRREDI
jgi:hypothetical protein